jgi:Putative lumazine-binding
MTLRPFLASLALLVALQAPRLHAAEPAHPDRDAVLGQVQGFFDALGANDGAALARIFVPGAQLTIAPRGGQPATAVRQRTIEQQIESAKTNKDTFLERGWSPTVMIEGRIATVWMPYDFHRNGQFSHDGIDVFVLMKLEDGWKIVSAAWTAEPGGQTKHPAGAP